LKAGAASVAQLEYRRWALLTMQSGDCAESPDWIRPQPAHRNRRLSGEL